MGASLGSEQFQFGDFRVELLGKLGFQLNHSRLAVGNDLPGASQLALDARDGVGQLLGGRSVLNHEMIEMFAAVVIHGFDKLLFQVWWQLPRPRLLLVDLEDGPAARPDVGDAHWFFPAYIASRNCKSISIASDRRLSA
jgi:hypothetical protein